MYSVVPPESCCKVTLPASDLIVGQKLCVALCTEHPGSQNSESERTKLTSCLVSFVYMSVPNTLGALQCDQPRVHNGERTLMLLQKHALL